MSGFGDRSTGIWVLFRLMFCFVWYSSKQLSYFLLCLEVFKKFSEVRCPGHVVRCPGYVVLKETLVFIFGPNHRTRIFTLT